eukprot:scaffold37949_cov205-Skeletonema_marinoi.AAC.3
MSTCKHRHRGKILKGVHSHCSNNNEHHRSDDSERGNKGSDRRVLDLMQTLMAVKDTRCATYVAV